MKKLIALVLFTAACGNTSSANEAVGQVKKVIKHTPLVCEDYTEVDVSLGVMRNGVGSMSKEDVEIVVPNGEVAAISTLQKAAESGAIVHVVYDVKRLNLCWPDHRFVSVTVEQAEAK
jgi:hypothetical protein